MIGRLRCFLKSLFSGPISDHDWVLDTETMAHISVLRCKTCGEYSVSWVR